MACKRIVNMHWTCDRIGCNEHGSGIRLPDAWRYMQMFKPHNKPGVKEPRECHALLCPACALLVKGWVHTLVYKPEEDEVKDSE